MKDIIKTTIGVALGVFLGANMFIFVGNFLQQIGVFG